MTSTLQTTPESPKTAYVGAAASRSTDRCLGARLHALLAAGLATLLVSLGVAVRPVRTYTAEATISLPASPGPQWSTADALQDGLALDSGALSSQLAAALKDDAALAQAAEAADIRASHAGATALLQELRSATEVLPAAPDAGPGARVTVESKNSLQAQALAVALADEFVSSYRSRALARGQQVVNEARQTVSATAAQAQDSQRSFDEFLASHFAEAATPAPIQRPQPQAPAAVAQPKVAEPVAEPKPASVAEAEVPAASALLPAESELQEFKQRRRELLVRYTKYHYKVQEVDMNIARLEKELAILAPKRNEPPAAPRPAEATPELGSPATADEPDLASSAADDAAALARAAEAEAETKRKQLNDEFAQMRAQVSATRAAAEQAVVQERLALEHQAVLAGQAELRVGAPSVTYRTAEGLDRRGVSWSLLLAATVGGLAFCLTGPQRHVYRSPGEVEGDLELPLVAALASRSAALPSRPKLLPAIAARLTACGELVLVAIVCGLAVLAILEPTFRAQLIENPLAAYADAASRLLGR